MPLRDPLRVYFPYKATFLSNLDGATSDGNVDSPFPLFGILCIFHWLPVEFDLKFTQFWSLLLCGLDLRDNIRLFRRPATASLLLGLVFRIHVLFIATAFILVAIGVVIDDVGDDKRLLFATQANGPGFDSVFMVEDKWPASRNALYVHGTELMCGWCLVVGCLLRGCHGSSL